jgi:hypothetical protein
MRERKLRSYSTAEFGLLVVSSSGLRIEIRSSPLRVIEPFLRLRVGRSFDVDIDHLRVEARRTKLVYIHARTVCPTLWHLSQSLRSVLILIRHVQQDRLVSFRARSR